MTFVIGAVVLLVFMFAVILMIVSQVCMILKETEDERVERLAEKRFREIMNGAKVRVYYHIDIVDEMHK